jgi:diguanylate cyclase (GGDEF)-like protein/PAS domain S-box-containing protein
MDDDASPPAAGLSDRLRLAVLDNLADGVYFVDRQRRITYWNAGAERLTGFSSDEVVGRRCRDGILNHCDAAGTVMCGAHCPLLGTMLDGHVREVHAFLHHKDGYRRPVCVRAAPLCDEEDRIIGAVEIFHDDGPLLAVHRRIAALEQATWTDPLTGIGNRRFGEMTLTGWLAQHDQYERPFGLLVIDIDHFKSVNDTYGHDLGDDALRILARTLAHGSGIGDHVVRWGGEEFVALVADVDVAELHSCAERLRNLVARSTFSVAGVRVPLTISIGGTVTVPGDSAASLVRRADSQLYAAKRGGRNQAIVDN